MSLEFAEFEEQLFAKLDQKASCEPGVRMQQERYLRDRSDWILATLKQVVQRNPSFVKWVRDHVHGTAPIAGDYGQWGELAGLLKALEKSTLSHLLKSEVYFYCAAIVAQQIENGIEPPSMAPHFSSLLSLFRIEGTSILLSSQGFLHTALRRNGVVQVSSKAGKIEVREVTDVFRSGGVAAVAARTRLLSDRLGWSISEERQERLNRAQAFEHFYGLSEFEVRAYFHSPENMIEKERFDKFNEVVYPLWKPDSLSMTISYHCNASCDHCYNASGPNRDKHCMLWKELATSVREWTELGVKEVGISGGEPFLFVDELVEILRGLRELGVERIVPFSNGFWGRDPAHAERILERLKAAGFGRSPADQIKISVGEFHQKDIDLQAVFTICELHERILGRKCLLDVEQITDSRMIQKLIWFAKQKGIAHKIDWKLRSMLSDSGRGKAVYKLRPQESVDYEKIRCPVVSRTAIYPERKWVYCSGTIMPKRHLELGALSGDSIYAVLSRAQQDHRLPYLQFGTFGDYICDHSSPQLQARLPRMAPKEATSCSVCRQVMGAGCA